MSDREKLAGALQQMIEHIRTHVPDAVINTRLAHSDQNGVVIHAQIMGGSGAAGSAHASAAMGDAAAEQAENRAIARAMIAMGLPPLPDTSTPQDATPTKLHSVAQQEQSGRVVQFPAQESERDEVKPDTGKTDDSGPEPEDISWTAFWTWARANGFANREALEAAIGQSINQLTPAQIRTLAQTVLDTQ